MDFLKNRSHQAIRRELRSIADSYHHYWDPIAELVQNARDAIDRAARAGSVGPHFIHISINATLRSIEVIDNGIGIPADRIHDVLSPGGGDKTGRASEVGEKGVGLTYSIFSGDDFEVQSRVVGQPTHRGRVKGARAWLDAAGDPPPPEYEVLALEYEALPTAVDKSKGTPPLDSYTRVRIGSLPPPPEDQDLFSLSAAQLKFLLRTRTALGVTNGLFGKEDSPKFRASYHFELAGVGSDGAIEPGFPIPHTLVADALQLEEVEKAFVTRKTDVQRTKFLKGKSVWGQLEVKDAGDTIAVYGIMFPGNGVFADLSAEPLQVSTTGGDAELADPLFRSGIFLATKGMPTGVSIEPAPGGRYPAYYKRCLFIVESAGIRFDLGRKSMHWRRERRLQDAVGKLFKSLEDVAPYQSDEKVKAGPGAHGSDSKAERDAAAKLAWTYFRNLVDLKHSGVPFRKVPDGQEAGVAAIFHELLGAGVLKGYWPLSTGYSERYDMHATYQLKPTDPELEIVVEFKHSLQSLIRDLENGRKNLSDVHLLVAWDADEQKLKDAKFDLERTNKSMFAGVTHELSVPIAGVDAIPVILLKEFLKK